MTFNIYLILFILSLWQFSFFIFISSLWCFSFLCCIATGYIYFSHCSYILLILCFTPQPFTILCNIWGVYTFSYIINYLTNWDPFSLLIVFSNNLPLCDFLNSSMATCHQYLGQHRGKYYDNLKFIVWDCEVKDGVTGAVALQPDLVGGKRLQNKDLTKATGLYWQPPNLINYQLLIPVKVKGSWPELICQAGTYACCVTTFRFTLLLLLPFNFCLCNFLDFRTWVVLSMTHFPIFQLMSSALTHLNYY
jgi:hypothetical protein